MECILNELSLEGQYEDMDDFIQRGVVPLSEVLSDMEVLGITLLYKKSDFYSRMVTTDKCFHELVFSRESRTNDQMRRMKNKLAKLQNEPFWDVDMKQSADVIYYWVKPDRSQVDVSSTALAEVYARSSHLVSFVHPDFTNNKLSIHTDKEPVDCIIKNVWKGGQLGDLLLSESAITTKQYICHRFHKKLDFEGLGDKNGFDCISEDNRDLFLDAFDKFEKLEWQEIMQDTGFEYKEFHKNRNTVGYFSNDCWNKKIYKIRIDQRIRCFGNTYDKVFHVIRIDLDHKLSDLG